MGVLIPDDKYDPTIEGYSLYTACMKRGYFTSSLTSIFKPELVLATIFKDLNYSNDNMKLILKLQNIHDNIPVGNWNFELQEFAKFHNITWSKAA